MCVNFIKFLSDSRQQQLSQIKLLSYLITNDFENFTPHCTSQLLQFALELFPYLSSSNFNVSPKPIENVSLATNLGIEDPNSPFIIPKRVLDVSLAMQRKLRLQKQKALSTHHRGALSLPTNVKFTPSHSQSLSDLPNNGTSFIFNFITKSTPVGHEGGSRPIPHHVEAAPAPTRDINELLERLEVLEHLRDEIIGFNIDINQLKYVIRDPGMKIYGPAWEEIESYLTSREVRQYVISRLRSLLPRIEDNHYNERTFICL
ncbi:hypothetical protein GPJ56_008949 [Histomonas meleagridis]|nr:hypothetical protein GPJ56_008949 [Histomonas meleagridis]